MPDRKPLEKRFNPLRLAFPEFQQGNPAGTEEAGQKRGQVAVGVQPIRAAIEGGALLPTQTESQREALVRLENLIATIDGWVDVVTEQALSPYLRELVLSEAIPL